jgi:hypothetical protein
VPGYENVKGNEIVNQLAEKKNKSEHPFTVPEPACGISDRAAKWTIRDWINSKHAEY